MRAAKAPASVATSPTERAAYMRQVCLDQERGCALESRHAWWEPRPTLRMLRSEAMRARRLREVDQQLWRHRHRVAEVVGVDAEHGADDCAGLGAGQLQNLLATHQA
jgi:hypothetical protein